MGVGPRRAGRAMAALIVGLSLFAGPAGAADPTMLAVNTYPNAKALPLFAGIAQGIFARRGLEIALKYTDNAEDQRKGLAQRSASRPMPSLTSKVSRTRSCCAPRSRAATGRRPLPRSGTSISAITKRQ